MVSHLEIKTTTSRQDRFENGATTYLLALGGGGLALGGLVRLLLGLLRLLLGRGGQLELALVLDEVARLDARRERGVQVPVLGRVEAEVLLDGREAGAGALLEAGDGRFREGLVRHGLRRVWSVVEVSKVVV